MSSLGNSQTTYEGLSDILLCYICYGKLKDAHMCPICSKISCLHCIKKWMRQSARSDCPHCRTKLSESDLINVRTVQELSDVLEMAAKRTPQDNSGNEICTTHRELLTVYCVTCALCICARCALWGEHRQDQGHIVKPLDELYKEQKDVLTAELRKLNKRISEIVSLVEQVDMKIERVKLDKGRTKQEIETVLGDIDTRLDEQARTKLQKLIDAKRHLKRQAHEISDMSAELEGKMNGSKSEFVLKGEELKAKLMTNIVKLQEGRKRDQEIVPEIGNFVNEVVPPYESAILEIKNFREKQRLGEEIYSPFLNFCGLSWRLKVYPNGNGDFIGKYLCMFVELCGGYNQVVTYHYSVELIRGGARSSNGLTNRNFKRDYSSEFGVGDLWGYKRFFDLGKLENEGFLVNDTLVLKLSVRHPTYHQKCRDLVLYVNDLKHKIMSLKHQNNQLRQKCQGLKDVDDPPPPLPPTPQAINSTLSNSSPAHSSSLKSNTGSNTSPAHSSAHTGSNISPAHSSARTGSTTSPAHSCSSHERSNNSLGGHLMFTASQPVVSGHFTSPRQPYHPMTPHAGLITPSSSSSTQCHTINPALNHTHYTINPHLMYQQEPVSGRYAPPTNHHGDQQNHHDQKIFRAAMRERAIVEQQQFSTQIPSGIPPLPNASQIDGGHFVLSQQHQLEHPPITNYENRGRGRDSHEFQELSPPAAICSQPDVQFTSDDFTTTTTSVSTLTGGGGGGDSNSQLGPLPTNYPALYSSQEYVGLPYMEGSQQKMFFDMSSQPDLIYYHQRNPPPQMKPYRTPSKSPQLTKRLSLTDLSAARQQMDTSGSTSRSLLALHEDPSRHGDGGNKQRMNLRPKSFHHSQGAIDMGSYGGAPGLAGTIAAKLAMPIDHHPHHHTATLPRSMANRRVHGHQRGGGGIRVSRGHPSQPPHGGRMEERQENSMGGGAGQQSLTQSVIMEVLENTNGSPNGRPNGSPNGGNTNGHTSNGSPRNTSGSANGSPNGKKRETTAIPPESISSSVSSQLTQEQAQTPKLRSSGRRYTQGKKRLAIDGRHTPTINPSFTSSESSHHQQQQDTTKGSTIRQQQQREEGEGGEFSRISMAHRTSSNTSLAAEII